MFVPIIKRVILNDIRGGGADRNIEMIHVVGD